MFHPVFACSIYSASEKLGRILGEHEAISHTLLNDEPQFLHRGSVARESVYSYNIETMLFNVVHELSQETR